MLTKKGVTMQTTHNERMRALITDQEAIALRAVGGILQSIRERMVEAQADPSFTTFDLIYLGVAQERAEVARDAIFRVRLSVDIEAMKEES